MRKTFWVTLVLFIMSTVIFFIKWDVIQERGSMFEIAFFLMFILLGLIVNFPFFGVVFVVAILLVIWLVVKKIDSEILKTIGLALFIFYTAIQLILAISLLGNKTTEGKEFEVNQEIAEEYSNKVFSDIDKLVGNKSTFLI